MFFVADTRDMRGARGEQPRQHQPPLQLHNENPKPEAFGKKHDFPLKQFLNFN